MPAVETVELIESNPVVVEKPIAPKATPSVPAKPQTAVDTLVDQLAANRPVPAISQAELFAAFHGEIESVRPTWTYRLALVLVGIVMLLLPVVYVGIICLVAYGMYLHAVYDLWFFQISRAGGRAAILAFVGYAGVLFAGGIALLFMIKPLFARTVEIERRRSLTRDGEPLLFAFVDRICDSVGSLRPRRIDVDCQVNASAGFRRGLWSVVVGNDLVLTIGLSLVAGINVQQFAGILAHEFGHFSQGMGLQIEFSDSPDQLLVHPSRSTNATNGINGSRRAAKTSTAASPSSWGLPNCSSGPRARYFGC